MRSDGIILVHRDTNPYRQVAIPFFGGEMVENVAIKYVDGTVVVSMYKHPRHNVHSRSRADSRKHSSPRRAVVMEIKF